jgi:hypothetical protein
MNEKNITDNSSKLSLISLESPIDIIDKNSIFKKKESNL